DSLFTLKKAFESAEIKFARNPQSKTQLELTFANARLQDAEQIFADNNNSPATQTLAINELNSQTQETIDNIKQQITSDSSVAKDASIISQIKTLAQNQANLIAKVDPKAAQQANQNAQQTVADIQKLIAVTDEQKPVAI